MLLREAYVLAHYKSQQTLPTLFSQSLGEVKIASEKLQVKSELPSHFHKRDQEAKQPHLTAQRDEVATTSPPTMGSQVWACFRTLHARGWGSSLIQDKVFPNSPAAPAQGMAAALKVLQFHLV